VVTVTAASDPAVAGETGTTPTDGPDDTGEAGDADTPSDGDDAGDTPETTGAVTRAPTRLSRRLSLVAAVTVTLLSGLVSVAALGLGLAAAVVLWGATLDGRQGLVDLGGLVLLVATVVAGTVAPVPVTLACTVGTVVAWDLATNAVELGEQLGREADTTRAEVTHALATAGVGVVLAALAYGVYAVAGGGQPVGAVIALLVGALALLSALRL